MKIKGSILFYVFVCLLVGGVYYFDYYKGEESEKKKVQDSILVPFLKDQIARIELTNKSGSLELTKDPSGSSWLLKKPIEDLVTTDETEGWIQSLITEKSLETIGEGEKFEWSTYGLDKPTGELTVTPKSGTAIHLQISAKKNFEGNPFIKKNDDKVVYVGNSVWTTLLEKTDKDLRDRRLLRKELTDLVGLKIKQGKSEIQWNLSEGKWNFPNQKQWHLDQNKVREFIKSIQDLKALEFVKETEPDPKELQTNYGISSDSLTVIFQLKGEKTWEAQFGQNKEKTWFIWPKDLKKIAKIDTLFAEKLQKTQMSEYRDREEPFNFEMDKVKKIKILGDQNLDLKKEGEAWKTSQSGTPEPVEIGQWMDQLHQLRVAEFLDGKTTAPGLDHSKRQYILSDEKDQVLLELRIGDSFKKKEDKIEFTYFYVKSSRYPDAFAIKEEELKALTEKQLIKTETKKDSQTKSPTEKVPQ